MIITGIDVQVVNLPLTSPFRSSFETKTGETRTVVRIRTDDGLVGWGETMWGAPVARLTEQLAASLIGKSPFALEEFHAGHKMVPFFYGYVGYAALAGLDVACWDLMGKITGRPLTDLIGGRVRDTVPITALITRADAPGANDADLPAALADHAAKVVAEGGFTAVKLKGTKDVDGDVGSCGRCATGCPRPSCASTRTPRGACRSRSGPGSLEELDLEYLEDPCCGIEGMAQVRAKIRIPLCTNMCVVASRTSPRRCGWARST